MNDTTKTAKWTEDRTAQLVALVEAGSVPVTKEAVDEFAVALDTTGRSIAAKLRNLGYAVEAVGKAPSAFTPEATAELTEFLEANVGTHTYAEIAAAVFNNEFSPKAVQGKILSLELTGAVKATPKADTVKQYTDAEEATVVDMITKGSFVEDIAEALGKTVASIRGKALSLQRAGTIEVMPKQRDVKGPAKDALEGLDLSALTVADIAAKTDRTERGVKTMLTRRGVSCADYDGAAKAEKAAAKKTA